MKTSPRSQKLAGVVKQALSPLLQQFTNPEKVGFLTIVQVEVSGDLGVVDVWIQSLNGPKNFLSKLHPLAGRITRELMKQIKVRRAFILRFKEL